uniref:Uncharacterized protein n=1 Tax=Kalanchoe fedtschenkoi TaxID=63787 RepID=A0A7N0U5Q4_KALFE
MLIVRVSAATKSSRRVSHASISWILDDGTNSAGAYLTDKDTKKSFRSAAHEESCIGFMFHGTSRQRIDRRKDWIQREKDELADLLKTESRANNGKLAVPTKVDLIDKRLGHSPRNFTGAQKMFLNFL